MSKKSAKSDAKTDDLLESIQDDRIINVLTSRLFTCLTPLFEDLFHKLAKDLKSEVKQMVKEVSVEVMSKINDDILEKIHHLEEENSCLRTRLDDMEIYSRLDNIVIHGLPEKSVTSESTLLKGSHHLQETATQEATSAVLDLCRNELGLALSESDISIAHRLPGKGKGSHRPILVKFATRRSRNLVYSARRSLHQLPAGRRIFINEHLTKLNATIFAQARKLVRDKKIFSTWSSGGHIFIRSGASETEKPKRITLLQELLHTT